jgi:UDP-N-acetylmuramate dehydrogenase
MIDDRLDARLRAIVGDANVRPDVPLAPFSTFDVGGPAERLVVVRRAADVAAILAAAAAAAVPVTVLGGGSNVVIADAGIRGLVLRLALTGIAQPSADRVRAEAGVTMNGLVRWVVVRGLAGLEAWAGTPGTAGGAIYGNAHYAGRNIGDLVTRAGLVTRDGRELTADRSDLEFGYDTSRLQRTGEVLLWAEFRVSPGVPDALRETAKASLAHRKGTQPLAMPSAGCIFQNPVPGRDPVPAGVPASAGALVDRAGLKGYRIGGASISNVHANFIVNDGTATAADIRSLVEAARAAVRTRFGVDLRDEVVFLGTF